MTFVNLTPHPIVLVINDEHVTVPASGMLARVGTSSTLTRTLHGMPVQVVTPTAVQGLPDPDGTSIFIVSGMVLDALKAAGSVRADVVAPGTGPNDGAIRNDKGHVIAVTRLNGLV